MKNLKKKGFTIVELVIVIAVIAVLAAVLIPTFVNLTRKANISADTVLAKNLNTAAISADAKNFDEAIEAVRDAGYLVVNLNTKAKDCYFVWDEENDQFLLVDFSENLKVIYSNSEPSVDKKNWFVAVSDAQKISEVLSEGCSVKKLVTKISDLNAAIEAGEDFYMDESVILNDANLLNITSGKKFSVNVGNSSIATNGVLNKTPIFVNGDAELTINGGSVGGAGNVSNENGIYTYVMSVDSNGRLILNDVKINTIVSGVTACAINDGDAYIEINDGVINAGGYAVSMSCGGKGGKAVINNTNTNAGVPFFVTQGSKVIINGGEHVSTGKTTQAGFSNSIFYINGSGSTIEVTGGKFTCNGVTKTYEELCKEGEDAWKNLCVGDYNIEISADKKTVTITE